jgi:hypothetical protein
MDSSKEPSKKIQPSTYKNPSLSIQIQAISWVQAKTKEPIPMK